MRWIYSKSSRSFPNFGKPANAFPDLGRSLQSGIHRFNNLKSNQGNVLILQESCTDVCGSYVIYAPVNIVAMNVVLNDGDPNYVALLPSGFAIFPDGTQSSLGSDVINDKISSGSSLTLDFQILVDSVPTTKLSLGPVATVNSLISCTVDRTKRTLNCENA